MEQWDVELPVGVVREAVAGAVGVTVVAGVGLVVWEGSRVEEAAGVERHQELLAARLAVVAKAATKREEDIVAAVARVAVAVG